jgi:putative ABC transport system permease protein
MIRDLLGHSLRSLRRARGVTATSICLLAATIGVITAIYAIVHAVVLRPFGFADQDRLAVIWMRDDRRALPVIEVALGEMEDWQARSRSFEGQAVIGSVNWPLTLVDRVGTESLQMSAVSASFFQVVGTAPLLGRGLMPSDEVGAVPGAMVVSHGLWVRRFGGDRSIVGRAVPVKLDPDAPDVPMVIVGVMPSAFDFPRGAEAWLPAAPLIRRASAASFGGPDNALRYLRVFLAIGKVRPGIAIPNAARELQQVMRTMNTTGGPEAPQSVVVTPIADYLLGPAGPVLRTLLAGAALMLLIACVTVAGLQVTRALQERKPQAVRAALGASSGRLASEALIESVVTTGIALAAALGVAYVVERSLIWLAPSDVPRLDSASLADGNVLLFAGAMAFITIGLCALWPALAARDVDVSSALTHGREFAHPRGRRTQRALVVTQIAVALTLLAGTALFYRTVRSLDRTTLGFDPDGLLAVGVTLPTSDVDRWNVFYGNLTARVAALPHVRSASGVLRRPLSGPIGWDNQPFFPGQVVEDPHTWGLNPHINLEVVTPDYFMTMGIRLVRGRFFSPRDTTNAPGVVIVSESAARRIWPGRDPIGQRLSEPSYRTVPPASPPPWQTVVGVVEDVRYRGLNDVRLDLYVPAMQSANKVESLMIRTDGVTAGVVDGVRAAARGIDPQAGVSDAALMRTVVDGESAPWRFLMRVFLAFAGLAATLAAIGLAAVIAMAVALRQRELAIRAALGANRRRLRWLVLSEAAGLVTAGVLIGLLGADAMGRAVAHVLIGVGAHDPSAMLGAAACVAAIGVAASWLPARRAADANPIDAMRAE